MLETPISVLVRRKPYRIARKAPLTEALRTLRTQPARCLVVMDGEHVMGLLTDRDFVEKCFHEGLPDDTPVEVVMDSPVISVTPDTPILEALRVVDRERIRNLPLIESDGTLRAVIRGRDLMEYLAESMPELILNQPPSSPDQPTSREGA
ncbi:MAG TPA: CBS domain-containing protein [Dehalococcoidia bacterium]|nr:CBS domain-containing protein [Dehalococcoidia bacterium]